ncbi:MAG: PAS domain-containing sensor histidine kinase [Limnobacter sp.]|nr:PAS domain-containing sensor histidine kinase [Limnobacter sp.]
MALLLLELSYLEFKRVWMFKNLSQLSHNDAWRKQLELLLDFTGDGIYGIDLQGRCVFINRAGADMLGYSPDEMLGRNMHYLIHHSYSNRALMPVCECKIFQAFQENKGCRVDNEVLWRRDGSQFPAEYNSYPIFEKDEIIGAVVSFSDITHRVNAQKAKEAARIELEKAVAQRTRELSRAQDRLRGLAAYQTSVREQERTRIARELHDDLGTRLTAFNLELNSLLRRSQGNLDMVQRLEHMLNMTEDAMTSLRGILSDLRPGLLDHLGLWPAIEQLLREAAHRSVLQVHLDLDPAVERYRFDRASETALYRMVQEALHNSQKHSQASRFCVQVELVGQTISLRLSDNGQGFCGNSSTGYGLIGMEERARDMGASFQLNTSPGQGVEILLTLPVRAALANV